MAALHIVASNSSRLRARRFATRSYPRRSFADIAVVVGLYTNNNSGSSAALPRSRIVIILRSERSCARYG